VIGPTGAVRVMVATRLVDFRKGAEGLAALVRESIQADSFSSAVYVFRAKRADRVKLIYWDGTGVCLFAKRLETGSFCWRNVQDGVIRLTVAQLSALLEGQVDGYAGYGVLAERGDVELAFCWSHVRWRFLRTRRGRSRTDRQRGARTSCRALRHRSPDPRLHRRRASRSPPREEPADRRRVRTWLRAKLSLISRKTKLVEAIRYALSRWDGLTRFIADGRIEIDSSVVERAIRPIALNRKNALFAGSDGGGEHWAVIASLIETCKLIGVDPHAYLANVITRIVNDHPNNQIDELLPWAYLATQKRWRVA